jgi:hypothetical protein
MGKGLGPDPGPADDPGAATLESRVDQVRVGDVLEPTRNRIEPAASGRGRVGDPGPDPALVRPPRPGAGQDLHQLGRYLITESRLVS